MENVILNGLKVWDFISREELIEVALKRKTILVAINAEKILSANSEIKRIVNNNIGYPDGIGAVWALKRKGLKNSMKIPGCELWLDFINSTYRQKSFYLVGGKQHVIEETVRKLQSKYSGIRIINFRNGYINLESEKQELIAEITEKQPDIVFVGMGSPRQELLMEEMHAKHKAVYIGLGGSFDVLTGAINRAPNWWIKSNLEWLYRLIKQPTRIKRQFRLLNFIFLLYTNKL